MSAVSCAALAAFVVVPLVIVSGAAPEDPAKPGLLMMAAYGALVSALVAAASAALLAAIARLGFERLAEGLALFATTWVVVAGIFLPVCTKAGMLDPEQIPTDRVHLAAVAAIAIGAASLASRPRARAVILKFLALSVLGAAAIALFELRAAAARAAPASEAETLGLSRHKSLLVVGFDGLPGTTISDLLRNDPALAAPFKDFVFYENAISQSPATQASLMADVYGVQDYKALGGGQAEVYRALDRAYGDAIPASKVADSFQYGYPFGFTRRMSLERTADPAEARYLARRDAFDVLALASVRVGTKHVLTRTPWRAALDALRNVLVPEPARSDFARALEHNVGPRWDRSMAASIRSYDYWIDHLAAADKDASLRYLHFTFTHYPVDFDERCAFRSDDPAWHDGHQDEAGLRAQARCALAKMGALLDRLRAIGVYDDALIVLKSDHGELPQYFSDPPDALRINGNPYWGYNRYRPLLMIKAPRASRDALAREPALVLLGDLARTLCVHAGAALDCARFHGADLLDPALDRFDEPYWLYVVEGPDSSFQFDAHRAIRVPTRRLSLREALERSGIARLSGADGNGPAAAGNDH